MTLSKFTIRILKICLQSDAPTLLQAFCNDNLKFPYQNVFD